MLQRVSSFLFECCGELQCVAVQCSVLQCLETCCSVLQGAAGCGSVFPAFYSNAAVNCSLLQCVAVCVAKKSVLQWEECVPVAAGGVRGVNVIVVDGVMDYKK